MILDLCTFDVGVAAPSAEAYAEVMLSHLEQSWDSGADLVVFPEYSWMGLEVFAAPASIADLPSRLRAVSALFWGDLLPRHLGRLSIPGKAVVLGTCPFADGEGRIFNRAAIIREGRLQHQDKLHLTPWEQAFNSGGTLRLWTFAGLTFAVIICLDIEIPELSARLRGSGVDVILCPSATETVLGVERVDRCASARAVELGCHVGVAHLVGRSSSALIDQNLGRTAFYAPSQADFDQIARCQESEVVDSGFQRLRVNIDPQALAACRLRKAETNPSLLGADLAGISRPVQVIKT